MFMVGRKCNGWIHSEAIGKFMLVPVMLLHFLILMVQQVMEVNTQKQSQKIGAAKFMKML